MAYTSREELLGALGATPANRQVGKPTTRSELLASLSQPSPSSDFGERLSLLDSQLTPPEGGWKRVTPKGDDSGFVGDAFKFLSRGVSLGASTAMETADLFTGEGASLNDWWNQFAGSEPIYWADVREKHPGIYKYAMPFTFGLSGIPAAFDAVGLGSVADFSADLIFDPLNALGGLGKLSSLKGVAGVADALKVIRLGGGATKYSDDVLKAAEKAEAAMRSGRSVSSGIRELRKLGPAGQTLIDDLGLEAGLRFRMPGSGLFGRLSQFDKIPGIAHIVAKRRAKQVPIWYKRAAGLTDSKEDVQVLANAIRAARRAGIKQSAAPGDVLGATARLASRTPVEFLLPKGLRATAASLRLMDAPIRGWLKFMGSGSKAAAVARTGVVGDLFNTNKHLDAVLNHEDPNVVAAWTEISTSTRTADQQSRLLNQNIEGNLQDAIARRIAMGISDEDLYELANFQNADDLFLQGVGGGRIPNPNLPEALKALSEEDLLKLHSEAVLVGDSALVIQQPHRELAFSQRAAEVLESEGGYVPRNLTAKGKELFPNVADEIPDPNAAGNVEDLIRARRNAANLQTRQLRVGESVRLQIPDDWVAPEGLRVRVEYEGRKRFITVIDEIQDPRVAGKSVARQVNEAAQRHGLLGEGEQVFETSFRDAWVRYGNTVGSDYRMRLIENVFEKFGLLVPELSDDLAKLKKLVDDATQKAASLADAKADASKFRKLAIKAGEMRRRAFVRASNVKTLGDAQPTNVGNDELAEGAVKWQEAFDVTNDHRVEVSIITDELNVINARIDELTRTRPKSGSIRSAEYEKTVEDMMDLIARIDQIRVAQEARDGVVNILKRMRDLEAGGLPGDQAFEARNLARSIRGGDNSGRPIEMYDALREELAEAVEHIEADVIPHLERLFARYAQGSPEINLMKRLVKASQGLLEGKDSALNINRAASNRIDWLNEQIKTFKPLDEAVGGHEARLATANQPVQKQLDELSESLERQTKWVEDQYAALAADDELLRAGQIVPEEALPGVRETSRTVPRAGESFDLEGPDVVLTEVEGLRRVRSFLGEQRSVALRNFAEANAEQQKLMADLQKRIKVLDQAVASGNRSAEVFERNMIKAGNAELAAQKIEFDELARIHEEADQLMRKISVALQRTQSIREGAGIGKAPAVDELIDQFDELLEPLRVHEAQPLSLAKDKLNTAGDIINDGLGQWGSWSVLGNENVSVAEMLKILQGNAIAKDSKALQGVGKSYNRLLNLIKSHQLTSFGFVSRNVMGAALNMLLQGVNPLMVLRVQRLLTKAAKAANGDVVAGVKQMLIDQPNVFEWQYMSQLIDQGVLRTGQGATSLDTKVVINLNRTARVMKDLRRDGKVKVYEFAPWRSDNVLSQSIQSLNNHWEDAIRLATGMHFMSIGGSVDTAFNAIAQSQFDYGELTQKERAVKMVIPFYTWTRKNIPYQFSQLWRQPGKYNALYTTKRHMEQKSKDEAWVPSYYMAPFGIRLPFAPGGNRAYYVPDLPFVDLFKFRGEDGNIVADIGRQAMTEVTPIIKAPIELMMQKQFFKELPLTDKYQKMPLNVGNIPGLKQALGSLGLTKDGKMRAHDIYVLEQFIPFYGRVRRLAPTEDKFQGYRQLQSMLSFFLGFPFRFNTDQTQRSAIMEFKRQQAAERRDMRDLMNPNR